MIIKTKYIMMKKLLFVFVLLFGVSMVTPVQADWYSQSTPSWSSAGYNFNYHNSFTSDFAKQQEDLRSEFQKNQVGLNQRFQTQNQQVPVSFEKYTSSFGDFSLQFPISPPSEPSDGNGDNDVDDDVAVPIACTVTTLSEITNYPPPAGPIIAFGDSLTAGVGASSGQDYVSELERMSGRTIINAGVSGDSTADALERLDEDVLRYNPSTVIVFLGGNDLIYRYYDTLSQTAAEEGLENVLIDIIMRLFGKVPKGSFISEQETFDNLKTIVENIQSTGAVVILVGHSGSPFDSNLSADYRRVANETGAILVPNALNSIVGVPSRMSDVVHPNNQGYDMLASRIYGALACVL